MAKDASDNKAPDDNFVGTSHHFNEANIHPQQKLHPHKPVAAQEHAVEKAEEKGPLATEIGQIFDALKKFDLSNQREMSFEGFKVSKAAGGKVEIQFDQTFSVALPNVPVPREPDTYLQSVSLPNPMRATYVKSADGAALLGVNSGAESKLTTMRALNEKATVKVPLKVTAKFHEFRLGNDGVLLGTYVTDVHYGIIPIYHPGEVTRPIYPLVADDAKEKPAKKSPEAPVIDESKIARE